MNSASNMSILMSYLPIILIVAIFYMLVLRPQAAAAKARAEMLKALTKGQTIVLQAGFVGTIKAVNDKTNLLEVELHPSATLVMVERTAVDHILTDATVLKSSVTPAADTSSFKKKR